MGYTFQPRTQITAAVVALLVSLAIGYFIYSDIDWITAISVAVGVFIGTGVTWQKKSKEKENITSNNIDSYDV